MYAALPGSSSGLSNIKKVLHLRLRRLRHLRHLRRQPHLERGIGSQRMRRITRVILHVVKRLPTIHQLRINRSVLTTQVASIWVNFRALADAFRSIK